MSDPERAEGKRLVTPLPEPPPAERRGGWLSGLRRRLAKPLAASGPPLGSNPSPPVDAYVYLVGHIRAGEAVRTQEVAPGVLIDWDAEGRPLGVEILGAQSVKQNPRIYS